VNGLSKLRIDNNESDKVGPITRFLCITYLQMFQKLLDMTINSTSGIRKQDAFTVITGVANNLASHDLAWNWLSTNWDHIANYFDARNSMKIGNVIKSCTEALNKFSDLESVNKFFRDNQDNLGTAISGTRSSIETVKANIEWISKGAKQVLEWLQTESSGIQSTPTMDDA
jgi:aminopeptidase N